MSRRIASVALAVCALLSGCTGSSGKNLNQASSPNLQGVGGAPAGVFQPKDRDQAPELSGRTLDGKSLDLASYRGKIVVVNFWASWCAPCRAEARNLDSVYAQTKALGVEFVGVDIKDEQGAALAFQRNKHIAYPSLFDQQGLLLLKFRGAAPQTPPTTLILDRQGRVAARFIQAVTETQLLAPVQVLAAEKS